jgi:putative serine protease PepD
VVGVNSQIATGGTSRGNVGVGFAVPSNTVREVLPALSRGERIRRPFIGVTTAEHPDGAEIQSITAGSPAADAGLVAGEVITSVAGRPVDSPDDVAAAISAHEPGDTVEVEVSDGGQERTVEVQLGTRP